MSINTAKQFENKLKNSSFIDKLKRKKKTKIRIMLKL